MYKRTVQFTHPLTPPGRGIAKRVYGLFSGKPAVNAKFQSMPFL